MQNSWLTYCDWQTCNWQAKPWEFAIKITLTATWCDLSYPKSWFNSWKFFMCFVYWSRQHSVNILHVNNFVNWEFLLRFAIQRKIEFQFCKVVHLDTSGFYLLQMLLFSIKFLNLSPLSFPLKRWNGQLDKSNETVIKLFWFLNQVVYGSCKKWVRW